MLTTTDGVRATGRGLKSPVLSATADKDGIHLRIDCGVNDEYWSHTSFTEAQLTKWLYTIEDVQDDEDEDDDEDESIFDPEIVELVAAEGGAA